MAYLISLVNLIKDINAENLTRLKNDAGTSMVYAELVENAEMIDDLVKNYQRESKRERILGKLI
jgi:hypothetical protein